MQKRILIGGSIAATILIVFASFTSVVGYNSFESSEIVDSPLFGIRTSDAIDKNTQDSFNCDFIGKGETIDISIQPRNHQLGLFQNIIYIIQDLDEKSYQSLINKNIKHKQINERNSDVNVENIITTFNQIRNIDNKQPIEKGSQLTTDGITFCPWYFGCWLLAAYEIIAITLFIIWLYLNDFPSFDYCPTGGNTPTCNCIIS